jgi:hypothetical protein
LGVEEHRIYELFEAITAREPLNRRAVERLFGVRLAQTDDTGVFVFYGARNVIWRGIDLTRLSFSEPIAGQGAEAGSTLEVEFSGFCADPMGVMRRVRHLTRRTFIPPSIVVVTDGGDPGPARFYRDARTRWGAFTLFDDGTCARSARFAVVRP